MTVPDNRYMKQYQISTADIVIYHGPTHERNVIKKENIVNVLISMVFNLFDIILYHIILFNS